MEIEFMDKYCLRLAKGAIDYIMKYHHDKIKVYITENDMRTFALHIETRRFDTTLYLYGHEILLAMLEYFTEIEEYEICKSIVENIKKHNKDAKDNIPTKL